MPEQKNCRVLVVDNNPEYAAQVAAGLEEIRPSLLNHNRLQIELTNTAYFVAERLRECPPGDPPWDVIISDVFMPLPSDAFSRKVPAADAAETRYEYDGKEWRYWEYQYSWNTGISEVNHGGFHIARTVKELKQGGKDIGNLKLVLISSRLFGENRELLEGFTQSDRSWLEYHDKALYQERAAMRDWPGHYLPRDIFKWALIQAISKRESQFWGDAIFNIVPNAEDFLTASRSSGTQEAIIMGRRLGSSRAVNTVLITGEIETGKQIIANVIHAERAEAVGVALAFVKVDCSTIPAEQFEGDLFGSWDERRGSILRRGLADAAAGGTLYFKDLDQLPPYHQGKLVTLLKDRTYRREKGTEDLRFEAELIICSMTRSPEELFESNLFHPDLYLYVKANRIHLSPLRERPDDIMPLAERAISRSGEDVRLTRDAEEWLRAQPWSGNIRDLMNTVGGAARRSTSSELTAADLQAVAYPDKSEPAVKATAGPDESRAETAPSASGSTADYVFKKVGEFWTIAYQGRRFFLKEQKGLYYIAWLLGHPRDEFHVLKFVALTENQQAGSGAQEYEGLDAERLGGQGMRVKRREETNPAPDARYEAELRRRLTELEDKLDYAEQIGDAGLETTLREEITLARKVLMNNRGLGGRERRDPTESAERARRAVYNNYTRSLSAIRKNDEKLWKHLYNSISTGEFLSYNPEQLPAWEL